MRTPIPLPWCCFLIALSTLAVPQARSAAEPPAKPLTTVSIAGDRFLINGKPYSTGTAPIGLGTGKVLLRFLNAGLQTHVPLLQGLHMKIYAEDGNLYPYAREQYSMILPAGKTMDAVITPTAIGTIPLYDRRLFMTNSNLPGGGMLANLQIGSMFYFPLIYKN